MNLFAGNLQSPPSTNPQQLESWNNLQGWINNQIPTWQAGQQTIPYAQNTFQNLYNNPYASQALGGAQFGAQLGGQAGLNQFGTGQALTGAGLGMLPYASQIMQTGFDPQQALYSRTLQQVQDQQNAQQAMRGIAMSPYGAGLANQATSNFNIDWQNQQLARQAQAAGAAGGLMGTGANLAGMGIGMETGAPGTITSSAMLPYAAYSSIGQGQNQALMSLLGALGGQQNLGAQIAGEWGGALGGANQMQNLQNQWFKNQLAQSELGWKQLAQLGSGIGSMFGLGG